MLRWPTAPVEEVITELSSERATHGIVATPARRALLTVAIHALWGSIAAVLGVQTSRYLLSRPTARPPADWVKIGDIASLPPEHPVEVAVRRRRVDAWQTSDEKFTAWVLRSGSDVVAFGPQCTHLGCAYQWDKGKGEFICPCHNSRFSREGTVLGGPATRPLDRYEVRLEGTKLLLGRLKRSRDLG
jgi:menaquinol-cytochrome c reductase iron-sulfur subunit